MRLPLLHPRPDRLPRGVVALLLAMLLATPRLALAHEFAVAIRADSASVMASAIRGMRLAATERDAHAGETSDGHLGGLDLFILTRPPGLDHGIDWLRRTDSGDPDITVNMAGAEDLVDASAGSGIVIGTGMLRTGLAWDGGAQSANDFAARYRAAYGQPPDLSAARAYNAARRIDLAVRPLGSVADTEALAESLSATSGGLDW